jgi:hypothetical protein
MRRNYVPQSPKATKTEKTLLGQLMDDMDEKYLVDVDSKKEFETANKSMHSEEAFNPQEVDEQDVDKADSAEEDEMPDFKK